MKTVKTKLNKGQLASKINIAATLTDKLQNMVDEFALKIAPLEAQIQKRNEEILQALQSMKKSSLDTGLVTAEVKVRIGVVTYPYKELWEYVLKHATAKQIETLTKLQKNKAKHNPDKTSVSYTR